MMKLKSLYWKLTLAFMGIAFVTAALVGIFIRLTSADRFMQFIIDQQRSTMEQALGTYYAENGSWSGVETQWQQIQFHSAAEGQATLQPGNALQGNPQDNRQDSHPPSDLGRRSVLGLADAQGKVLIAVDKEYPVGSTVPASVLKSGTPISADGQRVGTLLVTSGPLGFNPQEAQFLQRTSTALIYAILGAMVVALALGILLARTLTGPLQELTGAAHKISQGELEQQVRVTSNDEIGQLATAFNLMSQQVARSNQQRRQMTADIAHDLRTPLTVISGYIESMRDGVLKPTTERLTLIYAEIERLQRLVGDLRMLSLADAGELALNPQWLSPKTLLDGAADLFKHLADRQNVSICVRVEEDLPELYVDEARMMQILENLISNALRYTPAGGEICLSARCSDGRLDMYVQDSGTGIPPEELPLIFDRFHRADQSRHSEDGESGLGLAIVKALVELHGGSTSAESTPGQGTTIHLLFPVQEKGSK